MLQIDAQVPSFPAYVLVPVWGAVLIPTLISAWRLHDGCSSFLLLAAWLRYCFASFHEHTFQPLIFGISLIALTSIAMIVIGVIVVGARCLYLRRLTPFYGVISVVLISAIANQAWLGGLNATLKWLYLMVFALAAYETIRRHGAERIFRAFTIVFAAPILLQWISVLWGLKATTSDGETFAIGGFQHQQQLSIILLTFLFITCLSARLSVTAMFGRLAIVVAGLSLANYRTALLAAGPPAASLVMSGFVTKIVPRQRTIAFVLAIVVIIFALIGAAEWKRERFADLGIVWDNLTSLIQPPEHFTEDQRRLLSARVYLWSQYIAAYLEGDIRNAVVGFGPESWVGNFVTYAHNTFISYLYELGILGVAALTWVFISNLNAALRVTGARKFPVVACHIGFIILNLSTMALWTLEGAILYGLVLGYTWCLQPVGKREEVRGLAVRAPSVIARPAAVG